MGAQVENRSYLRHMQMSHVQRQVEFKGQVLIFRVFSNFV